MACLKTLIKNQRFIVRHNNHDVCVDCVRDGKVFVSQDMKTELQGSMTPVNPEELVYSPEHTITNNSIIRTLDKEGYDEVADTLRKIKHR